jgi:hypothetical protein
MNKKSLAVVTIAIVEVLMLVASFVGTNAIFTGGYGKNQAASQAIACDNGKLPSNTGCQIVASQVERLNNPSWIS